MGGLVNTGADKKWRVVYTKPRSEIKSALRLRELGIEVYCPVQTTLRQWSDRKKKISVPVFPSYVFLKVSQAQSHQVLQDPGVLNFVYWLGQPALIREQEIQDIKSFLSEHKDASVEVGLYSKGDLVEINAGPLKGQKGTVDSARSQRAVLYIESLGMVVKVDIKTDRIKRVQAPVRKRNE